jgi:Raf kinase inhibitor-like YbhB/YbcL family protein
VAFTLASQSFKEGETLAMDHILSADYGFGCGGGNKSPQLSWSGIPEGTKSFAVSCFDPDAPTGSGFWHWVVVNIPAGTTSLALDAGNPKAGLMPKGALQTRTDFGAPGYGGPCPPEGHGPHRYVFTLFAVRQEALPVNADTSAAIVGFQLHFNTIAKATLTGKFQR